MNPSNDQKKNYRNWLKRKHGGLSFSSNDSGAQWPNASLSAHFNWWRNGREGVGPSIDLDSVSRECKQPKMHTETSTVSDSHVSRKTESQKIATTHGFRESAERKQEAIVENRRETREIDGKISVENISTVIDRETLTCKQQAWKECIMEVTVVNDEIEERGVHRAKQMILSIQNNPRSSERMRIMHAIKVSFNKNLPACPDGQWPIMETQSLQEQARREKLNIEIKRKTDEWNEIQKTHREGMFDMDDQHDACNNGQREGSSLEEIANWGNIFAKKLLALTPEDPLVKSLCSFRKFTVNEPRDIMFASVNRPTEISNDVIGISPQLFVGDLTREQLSGITCQEGLDEVVAEHIDGGSMPPNRVGIVMKTFAASIYSRLQDGDSDDAADMMQRAQKAWKLMKPYFTNYSFSAGVVVTPPKKSPLMALMTNIDPQWRALPESALVEEIDTLMNVNYRWN